MHEATADRRPELRPDCLIVGGGPAGALLALLLARRGLGALLVDRGRPQHSGPYETMVSAQSFARHPDIAGCAAVDELTHGAIWGGDTVVWRPPGGAGLWLERGTFDAALRAAAAAAGAAVSCPARVTPADDGAWTIADAVGAVRTVRPAAVAFATGRAARVPGLPEAAADGPPTAAITLVGEPAAADRGTAVVEAVRDGWIWTHAPRHGPAAAAFLCDERERRTRGTAALVAAMRSAARGPAGRLREPRIGFANDATARHRGRVAGAIVLGDAAATIDPLASQGVEKALAAADHAAAVIATGHSRPEWWPRLAALQARWEHGLAAAHAAVAADYYGRETRFADAPFWRARAAAAPAAAGAGTAAVDTPFVVAPTVRIAPVLQRHGDAVVEVSGAVDANRGDELARVGEVSVPALLALFAAPRTLPAALAAAGSAPNLFVSSPRAVHAALAHLVARGWLTAARAADTR